MAETTGKVLEVEKEDKCGWEWLRMRYFCGGKFSGGVVIILQVLFKKWNQIYILEVEIVSSPPSAANS